MDPFKIEKKKTKKKKKKKKKTESNMGTFDMGCSERRWLGPDIH